MKEAKIRELISDYVTLTGLGIYIFFVILMLLPSESFDSRGEIDRCFIGAGLGGAYYIVGWLLCKYVTRTTSKNNGKSIPDRTIRWLIFIVAVVALIMIFTVVFLSDSLKGTIGGITTPIALLGFLLGNGTKYFAFESQEP